MIILPEHKAVYISHQRCGSHTMFDVLCNKYGGFHWRGDSYHGRAVPPEYADWYWFSTCRNPYSLAVSIWRSTGYGKCWRFSEIVADSGFLAFSRILTLLDWSFPPTWGIDGSGMSMSQREWFEPVRHNLAAVLPLETLADAVTKLPFWREGDELGYANNRTDLGRPSWRTYYEDERAVKNVQQWAGPDFDIFHYDRESYKLP